MHIDHSKLVELLVETSGIEKKKVESQLSELVEEINEAIDEGEAYEVDGFGVFSAIGNNVVFIPADELATEINYKYVGMEAIEMDDAVGTIDEPDAQDEDDPFAGLLGDEPEEKSTHEPATTAKSKSESNDELEDEKESSDSDSPFGFENEDQTETEGEVPEEKPGPDKWGIDTYKDAGDESMFSGLLGDAPKEESEQEEEHFKAVFDQEDSEDEDLERISEIERELSGESDEDTTDTKSDDEDSKDDIDPFATLAKISGNEEDEGEDSNLKKTLESSDDEQDDLEDSLSSSISEEQGDEELEPVPVIKNITSGKTDKNKETKKDKERKPFKRPQKAKKTGSPSAILLIIVIIIVIGSGIYGLGYLGVVNIPGITPAEIPATTQTTPPAPNPEVTEPMQEPTGSTQETTPQQTEQTLAETEQETDTQVSETQEVQEQATTGEASYGLTGSLSEAANDGYTIAVYSLTNEDNARAKVAELSDQGYRVILASVPHQQYGTLWRVSLGQFKTMREAALAAEELGDPFTDNYFVTQIQ